ncbi:sterol carrier family protein [Agromyces sp. SYSU T00194]|uniref:sterol carrier family protein n=1 Tax=Agromyces chitinivorans TaxID=3158560 RepID=UPI00339AA434
MARARINDEDGWAALRAAIGAENAADHAGNPDAAVVNPDAGAASVASVDRPTLSLAVHFSLQLLAEKAPGNTLEVRVPPFAVIQCVEGPRHTRGTPPNVIETDAATWLGLASGSLSWEAALASGAVQASGTRADLTGLLPLV